MDPRTHVAALCVLCVCALCALCVLCVCFVCVCFVCVLCVCSVCSVWSVCSVCCLLMNSTNNVVSCPATHNKAGDVHQRFVALSTMTAFSDAIASEKIALLERISDERGDEGARALFRVLTWCLHGPSTIYALDLAAFALLLETRPSSGKHST